MICYLIINYLILIVLRHVIEGTLCYGCKGESSIVGARQ